jgi:N-methylhydantoinase B
VRNSAHHLDPIRAQVLRTHLEAIAEEGFQAIRRTAISPIVTEALDAACTLTDAAGRLIAGGGRVPIQYGAATVAVKSVLELHGDSLSDGDVFFGNDPHSGIAVHPQDVIVLQPVFVDSQLVAWVANMAHLMDVGGMSFGSLAPAATECYQEAIRMPPVRLFKNGVEQVDVWAILRNNVRLPILDEMDMRGLVAGCHVARAKLVALIEAKGGVEWFGTETRALQELTEMVLRRRIAQIADGIYRSGGWVEWDSAEGVSDLYWIPCTLTVINDRLLFDFEGVGPQCTHYINSKEWIVHSRLCPEIWNYLGQDVPLNQGVLNVVEVHCPEKSLLNCDPPAPIGAAHSDFANLAAALAISCLVLALAASEEPWTKNFLAAQSGVAASAVQVWRTIGPDGVADAMLMADGVATGSHAAAGRDGNDLGPNLVARRGGLELTQIEVMEAANPVLILERRTRAGSFGAGRFRAGAGCEMSFRPHHCDLMTGVMNAKRPHLPLLGMAGGQPGATTSLRIRRNDGSWDVIAAKAEGISLQPDEVFEFKCTSGGGFGDPLDRELQAVVDDVCLGRVNKDEARDIYGVLIDSEGVPDEDGTFLNRSRLRLQRLEEAKPASWHFVKGASIEELPVAPLYPGVEQRGNIAVATESGAVLAVAPNHWTDGCPTVTTTRPSGYGSELLVESYLDPISGRALFVDVRFDDQPRSFESLPQRWITQSEPH